MLFSFVVDSVLHKAVFKEQKVIVVNRNGGSTLLGEVLAVFHIVVVKCHFYLRSGPVNYNASQINGFCRPAEVVRIVSAKRVQPLLLQRQVSVIGVGFFLSDPLESGNIQPDRCFFVYLIFNHNILGRKERVGDCNANGNISVRINLVTIVMQIFIILQNLKTDCRRFRAHLNGPVFGACFQPGVVSRGSPHLSLILGCDCKLYRLLVLILSAVGDLGFVNAAVEVFRSAFDRSGISDFLNSRMRILRRDFYPHIIGETGSAARKHLHQ